MKSRRQRADTVRRPGKDRRQHGNIAEDRNDGRFDIALYEGSEDEQAPDAVDDRGDAGQKLDRDADRTPQHGRADFGQEDGDAETDRHSNRHGDHRSRQGPDDRRACAEFFGDGIPYLAGKKAEPEGAQGRNRALNERCDDPAQDQENDNGRDLRGIAKDDIAEAKSLQRFRTLLLLGLYAFAAHQDVGHNNLLLF